MNKELIDNRTLQAFLKSKKAYTGGIDGDFGPGSQKGVDTLLLAIGAPFKVWSAQRRRTAVEQFFLTSNGFGSGTVDGLVGQLTLDALERYHNHERDVPPPQAAISHLPNRWPREGDVLNFYGHVGENQVMLDLPFQMLIAWDPTKKVKRVQCHAKVHDSLGNIFAGMLKAYGEKGLHDLRLDRFGGCLNVRQKKGGRTYSMHSWGIAVDLDPEKNSLHMTRQTAEFAKADYEPFWQEVEKEGWVSLGREKNYDWMHFQAARF